MDRRTLLAVTLCFLIFMGWQKFYIEPHMIAQTSVVSSQVGNTASTGAVSSAQTQPPAGQTAANNSAPPTSVSTLPVETRKLNLGTSIATVGNGTKFFTGWELKSYRLDIAPEAAAVDLHSVTNQQDGEGEFAFDQPELAYINTVRGKLTETAHGVIWNYEDQNVKLSREYTSHENKDYADLKITAEFKAKKANYAFVSMSSESWKDDPAARDRQIVYFTNKDIERVTLKDTQPLKEVATAVKWIGATNRYFLMSMVTQDGSEPKGLIQTPAPYTAKMSMVYPITGNTLTIPLRVYFGPKELDLLRAVDPTLDHTIDFGWFTLFAYPLLKGMRAIYELVHNYGVAIILLTIMIKVLTYPLTYKSMKSMKEMAKLQPQLAKIREKYKDDKEALNREMLTIMRGHGYNPLAGCLPIVIQMPVFFALYRVLYSSIELYHAPFAFWIHDLSSKDPYFVTPVLLSLTMFIQQKVTPNTATDPAQAKMMQFMPLIFGFFMISLPAGLTIYMLVNAMVSILQQLFLNKKLGGGSNVQVLARAK